MSRYTIPMVIDVDGPVMFRTLDRIRTILRESGINVHFAYRIFPGEPRLCDERSRTRMECSCCGNEDEGEVYTFACQAVGCGNFMEIDEDPDTGEPVCDFDRALEILVDDHGWQIGDRGVQRGKPYCPSHRIGERP